MDGVRLSLRCTQHQSGRAASTARASRSLFDGKANLALIDSSRSQQVCEDRTERDLHRRPRRTVSFHNFPPHFLQSSNLLHARNELAQAHIASYRADCIVPDPSSTLTARDRSSQISTTPSSVSSEDSSTLEIVQNILVNARLSRTPSVSVRSRNSSRTSARLCRRWSKSGMR